GWEEEAVLCVFPLWQDGPGLVLPQLCLRARPGLPTDERPEALRPSLPSAEPGPTAVHWKLYRDRWGHPLSQRQSGPTDPGPFPAPELYDQPRSEHTILGPALYLTWALRQLQGHHRCHGLSLRGPLRVLYRGTDRL